MSTEQNKAIMRRFNEASIVNDRESLETLLAPDFVIHQADGPGNREAYLQHLSYYAAAFSDAIFTVEEQIAEGDRVVTRGTYSATHSGDFQGLPPSSKRFAIDAVLFDRIVDGQIVEHRSQFDTLSMLQQLGVVPPPQPAR
jgi:steroid delta-isomerase-like uncharacterized protein